MADQLNTGLHVNILPNQDTSDLDPLLLDDSGLLKVVPASTYASIPWDKLRLWTHQHAVYGLPTVELVDYLRDIIGERKAIEIGAGNGCLGRALGIPMTDNYLQERPDMKALYALQGQPCIEYAPDVEKLDALDAVRRYRPQVVVASWVTQYSDGSRSGSVYGIHEETLLDIPGVETYLLFGSIRNHGFKSICERPHTVIREPWLWSRADDSVLFIWGRQGKQAGT